MEVGPRAEVGVRAAEETRAGAVQAVAVAVAVLAVAVLSEAVAVINHLLCRQVQAQPLEVPIGEKGRRLAGLKELKSLKGSNRGAGRRLQV